MSRAALWGEINTDDEPVPAFVHQMHGQSLFTPTVAFTSDAKGTPTGDPDVTMRLETPVLYFHLPQAQQAPIKFDVDVTFHGGWLSQFFPLAQASIDGTKPGQLPAGGMAQNTSDTTGRLAWHGLVLNAHHGEMPATNDPVWTSPRAVESTAVTIGDEAEQFLFYRGVGHLDAPLNVIRHADQLEIHAAASAPPVGKLWLVDIRPDGALAFREVAPSPFAGAATPFTLAVTAVPAPPITTPATFEPADYSPANLARLRLTMRRELVAQGLFSDEADCPAQHLAAILFSKPRPAVVLHGPSELDKQRAAHSSFYTCRSHARDDGSH